jgi:hypothetical protein
MMKRIAMALMVLAASAALVVGEGKGDKAKCLENCKDGCQKTYSKCVKDAKTDAKKKACQESLDLCNSYCVNKTCR